MSKGIPVTGAAIGIDAEKLQGVDISVVAPTDNQVLTYDSGSGKYVPETISLPSGVQSVTLYDFKPAGTDGGTATAGVQTRDLNTVSGDPIVTLSGNQFTLQAGVYLIECRAPCYATAGTVAFMWSITDSGFQFYGGSHYADSGSQVDGTFGGWMSIPSAKTYEVRQFFPITGNTNGLGVSRAYLGSGQPQEVYTRVIITKIR